MNGGTAQNARIMASATKGAFADKIPARNPDPLQEALDSLAEWDRKCRELHEQHMAELAECRRALKGALS